MNIFSIKNLMVVSLMVSTAVCVQAVGRNDLFTNNTEHSVRVWVRYPGLGCNDDYFVLDKRGEVDSVKTIQAGLCKVDSVKVHVQDDGDRENNYNVVEVAVADYPEDLNVVIERNQDGSYAVRVSPNDVVVVAKRVAAQAHANELS